MSVMHRSSTALAGLAFLAVFGAASAGRAQTVTASGQLYPHRILNGMDIGQAPRAQNLTPLGVNYADCIQDQSLQFSLTLSGFTGQDLQIWASRTGTCTTDSNRGNGGVANCWPLGGGLSAINMPAANIRTFTIRVQDIVGPQNLSPSPTTYVAQGPSACATQPTFSSETISIYFIPITNGSTATGMAWTYQLPVDMVGPPAPAVSSKPALGDTLFIASWTPNTDADTQGYDVYIDPIPGQEPAVMADGSASDGSTTSDASTYDASAADASMAGPEPTLVCPDAQASGGGATDAEAGAVDSGGDGAPTDASACYYLVVPPASQAQSSGGNCVAPDPLLSGAITNDGGSGAVVCNDGGDSCAPSGTGGISTVPCANIVGFNACMNSGLTVPDKAASSFQIKGLKNFVGYSVAVSAVDAFGNIGPPSGQICGTPQPVTDFWDAYRNAGGQAGGGFCALEAVGMPVGASVGLAGLGALGLAALRRRRRPR
jgi:hypothetical protein